MNIKKMEQAVEALNKHAHNGIRTWKIGWLTDHPEQKFVYDGYYHDFTAFEISAIVVAYDKQDAADAELGLLLRETVENWENKAQDGFWIDISRGLESATDALREAHAFYGEDAVKDGEE